MRVAAALALACVLAIGGCDRLPALDWPFGGPGANGSERDAEQGTHGGGAAPMVEPGSVPRAWRPADQSSQDVTGRLTASLPEGRAGPLVLAFANGLTYQLTAMGIQLGDDPTGIPGGADFAETLRAPSEAAVFVYRVEAERIDGIAPRGGLCGDQKATYLAVSEFVNGQGEWAFHLAAFRGAVAPGPSAAADPALCAVYGFGLS